MQARKLIVRVEADEAVAAVYARDLESMPDALFLRVGALHLTGRPAHVVAVLESALHECLRAWASGYADADAESQDGAPRRGNGNFHVAVNANPSSVSDRASLLQLSPKRRGTIAVVPAGDEAGRDG